MNAVAHMKASKSERERERELYRFSQDPTVSHVPVCAPHLSCVPELPWDRRVVDPANKADQVLKLYIYIIQTNDPKIITKQSKGEVKLFNHVNDSESFCLFATHPSVVSSFLPQQAGGKN